jgi:ATP-dependent RNA helicase RhlB
MLFSATLDYRTKRIASSYMNHPKDVAVQPEQVTAEGIDQMVYHVDRTMKFKFLLGILSREEVTKGLIFANQKVTVSWLAKKLSHHGYDVALLTGDLPQAARNRILDRFKRGKTRLLVASDVASRGLHIDDVTHIINYDLPQDPEDYVHRIGRTARAGKKGKAYTLACDEYCYSLPEIEKLVGEPLPYAVPYDEDYGEDRTPEFTIQKMIRQERREHRESEHGKRRQATSRGPSRHGLRTYDQGSHTTVATDGTSKRRRRRGPSRKDQDRAPSS